jgi:hypothetical protein
LAYAFAIIVRDRVILRPVVDSAFSDHGEIQFGMQLTCTVAHAKAVQLFRELRGR